MKFIKRIIFLALFIPLNIFAYSIIPSGENIGINLNMKGVLVVGSYKLVKDILNGDLIIKIEFNNITKASDMGKYINDNIDYINITFLRKNKEKIGN